MPRVVSGMKKNGSANPCNRLGSIRWEKSMFKAKVERQTIIIAIHTIPKVMSARGVVFSNQTPHYRGHDHRQDAPKCGRPGLP